MGAQLFKGVFIYELSKQGWTETWWSSAGTIDAAAAGFKGITDVMCGVRHYEVTLKGIRIGTYTDNVSTGSSRLLTINQTGVRGSSLIGAPTGAEDVGSTCALIRVAMDDGSTMPLMLRGLSDNDMVRDLGTGDAVPEPGLWTAIQNLAAPLIKQGLGTTKQAKPGIKYPILGISQSVTPPNGTKFTIAAGFQIKMGDYVIFHKPPKATLPWLKGQWKVAFSEPDGISLSYPFNMNGTLTPVGMEVVKVDRGFRAVSKTVDPAVQFVDFRGRQTGRPIMLTRGRSSGTPYRKLVRAVG